MFPHGQTTDLYPGAVKRERELRSGTVPMQGFVGLGTSDKSPLQIDVDDELQAEMVAEKINAQPESMSTDSQGEIEAEAEDTEQVDIPPASPPADLPDDTPTVGVPYTAEAKDGFPCPDCSFRAKTKAGLGLHIRNKHSA